MVANMLIAKGLNSCIRSEGLADAVAMLYIRPMRTGIDKKRAEAQHCALASRNRAEGENIMAKDPKTGFKVIATVEGVKGACAAEHRVGDEFEISCYNPGQLCGWFYHLIFPDLCTFQYGGKLPWWESDSIQVQCPDAWNAVTLRLQRFTRDEEC